MSSVRIAGAVAVVATLGCALAPDVASAAAGTRCGTKELYGKRLTIRVLGRRIPCAEVRQIVRGSCRAGRVWSCFSFRPPDPLLVWFPESERFAERWSTTIEARRTPCGEA